MIVINRTIQIALMCLVIIIVWPQNYTYGAKLESLFNQGNEAYSRDNLDEAIMLYEECLNISQSAALHYNLGNAWYKSGKTGNAILHYEKSLALQPGNPDVQANLKFVRENSDLTSPEYHWITRIAIALSLSTWCWICTVSFWAMIALYLLPRLYGVSSTVTRMLMATGAIFSLISILALYGYQNKNKEVVILNNDTTLRVAPTEISPSTAYVQAGELAIMERAHQNFLFLSTPQGKSGWVLLDEIGKIWE